MADTTVANVVTGATPTQHTIVEPTVSVDETGTGDVWENADSERIVAPNSIIKYINVCVEVATRGEAPQNPGWLEWAFQARQFIQTVPSPVSNTNLGIQTLGAVCTQRYRKDSLYTGCIPVSKELPNVINLMFKIPKRLVNQQRGQWFTFQVFHRSVDSTDTTTQARVIISHNYKVYI